jgi:hypothetical protein
MRILAAFLAIAAITTGAVRDAGAIVIYRAEGTHNLGSGGIDINEGFAPQTVSFGNFSYGGALCPAPGTPNFACGRVFAQADLVQGRRVVLRSESRLTKTNSNGLATLELVAAIADVQIYTGTATSSPVGTAYVDLLLSGTESATTSEPGRIVPEAFHTLRVNGTLTQCTVGALCKVEMPDWNGEYVRLTLRTDARVTNPEAGSLGGWSAEMISDFSNTLELVAIELYDTNGQRITDAQVTVGDGMGGILFDIPTSVEETTTTTIVTTTTSTSTTSTLPVALDDLRCYPAKTAKGTPKPAPRTVRLVDDLEDKSTVVEAVTSLCNPAGRNGDGIGDPTAQLACYKIKDAKSQPKFAGRDVLTSDQLGDLALRLAPATALCVPSAPTVDHFKCYAAKIRKGTPAFVPRTVTVTDQFETKTVEITKPLAVCTAVNKNDEGVPRPDDRLVCYAGKEAKKQPAFEKRTVAIANQLGEQTLEVKKSNRVCLPATVVLQ